MGSQRSLPHSGKTASAAHPNLSPARSLYRVKWQQHETSYSAPSSAKHLAFSSMSATAAIAI
jgi:hypothetical protein